MFVYVEYVSRRAGVPLPNFQALLAVAQGNWAGEHGADQVVLNIGRTWRLGPEPEYLTVWVSRAQGPEHLGAWEDAFQGGGADGSQMPFDTVARIDRAGCFRSSSDIARPAERRHYLEFFEPASGATESDIDDWYRARAGEVGASLTGVIHRIGMLAPHAGIAMWALSDYGQLTALSETTATDLLRVADAGVYADVGEEIL